MKNVNKKVQDLLDYCDIRFTMTKESRDAIETFGYDIAKSGFEMAEKAMNNAFNDNRTKLD